MGFIGDAIGGIAGGIGGLAGKIGDAAEGVGGGLLKLVFPQVDGVLSQLTQAGNMIQDLVKTPMNDMLKEVEGGQVWRGPGADAFKQDLTGSFLPEVQGVRDLLDDLTNWVKQSKDAIQSADEEAVKEVDALAEAFKL